MRTGQTAKGGVDSIPFLHVQHARATRHTAAEAHKPWRLTRLVGTCTAAAERQHQRCGVPEAQVQPAAGGGPHPAEPAGRCGHPAGAPACLHHLAGPLRHPALHRLLRMCCNGAGVFGTAHGHGHWLLLGGEMPCPCCSALAGYLDCMLVTTWTSSCRASLKCDLAHHQALHCKTLRSTVLLCLLVCDVCNGVSPWH